MSLLRLLPLVLLTKYVLSSALVVHESISHVPAGCQLLGSSSPTQEIELLVAIVQSNITGLAKVVDAASFPLSPTYGQYLTAAEVAEYVKPAADSVSAVAEWLPTDTSPKAFTPAGDILKVTLTVEQAEGLLNTTFRTYKYSATGQEMVRAMNYSLPSTMQQHILFVHPIIAFTPPQRPAQNTAYKRRAAPNRRQLAPCEDIVQPVCIQEYYGIPNTTISGSTTNTIGVAGYNDEYANNADLATLVNEFRPDIAGNTFNLALLNGAENLQNNSGGWEGALDIQYTAGVANVPTTYVLDLNESGDTASSYMDIINWILAHEPPPTVFTTSYGNEEVMMTQSAATSICNAYMQLAALDVVCVSMIFSSGDGEYHGGADDSQVECTEFVPMFPPTCPYGRFEKPQEPATLPGVFNAASFGPACPQQDVTPPSRVSRSGHTLLSLKIVGLSLNVFRPTVTDLSVKLPVLVWLYGGGWEVGNARDNDLTPAVERSIELGAPIVAVALNYRLNGLGFLAGKEVAAAGITNLGLRDQIFGLQWVQKYISAFGGDPEQVVLGGISAGSISTSYLTLNNNQNSNTLFRGVFLESGPPGRVGSVSDGQPYYDDLVAATDCSASPDTLGCLRQAPLDTFMAAVNATPNFFSYQAVNVVWSPRIDGDIILQDALISIVQGMYAEVIVIFLNGEEEF
ncbi:Carboxylic ester hydrolase [Mycena sanguinolenta]|uniref:Carboxylic ester hydrolase n=1 Tax=Mycena sanguinolenta TaxID=230812 RepID=A0A8H7CSQ7_9AGAR|nr:Carboxylic ester hydrolase [Mycena sanguinolenta]